MKEVIKAGALPVSTDNLNVTRIYAFNDGEEIIKIHDQGCCGNWVGIGMGSSTNGYGRSFNTIKDCVEHYQQDHIIYEFSDTKDFFANADKMEVK